MQQEINIQVSLKKRGVVLMQPEYMVILFDTV